MTTALSVNLNAVAMLRNRRDLPWPSVTAIGRIALEAGAAGLTVHPRPDQRHIRFHDVGALASVVADFPDAEFNIEGYPTSEFIDLVLAQRPHQVTLVPDDPSQATSDHGWDFAEHLDPLREHVGRLRAAGLRVCLFCDPDAGSHQLEAAAQTGAHRLELYTGPYGATFDDPVGRAKCLDDLEATADAALQLGLGLNAGHDLTVENLPQLVERVPAIAEVSIGHGLTADALIHGMAATVRRFLGALSGSESDGPD